MNTAFPDYSRFPRECEGCHPLEEVLAKVRSEYAKVLNAWLEWCVEQWCPEAFHCYQLNDVQGAVKALNRFGCYYACLPGDRYEFRQGDTVLVKCVIEYGLINPTVRNLTP